MDKDRLGALLAVFYTRRIAVLGDYFVDKYLDYDPNLAELSLETGKTANQVVQVRSTPGAAGTVVGNLSSLGAGKIIPVGFCGDDGEGYELRQGLVHLNCDLTYLFITPERRTPTYLKPRNIRIPNLEGEAERYDIKNRESLPTAIEAKILEAIRDIVTEVDALIVMDQVEEENCGAVTKTIRDRLAEIGTENTTVIFWADSRRRIRDFRNVIVKVNQQEAIQAFSGGTRKEINIDLVLEAGHWLYTRSNKPVFVTRGENGIILFDETGSRTVTGLKLEGFIDPTGAGDSASAAAVLTLASGGSLMEAAVLANLAASLTLQQIGTTGAVNPEHLPARLALWQAQNRKEDDNE